MIPTIIISLSTCLGIVLTSIFYPNIKIKKISINLYWLIALVGALILLISNTLTFAEFGRGLVSVSSINPLQILILFICMSLISIFLDETGFFEFLANWTLKKCGDKQIKIFVSFYILVALLTMFTSNDIVILTLTPFIINFTKKAKISPIPYLISEFVSANTWSMMFLIGNPTNIYLSQTYNISFVDYFLKMAIPTLVAGLVEFIILFAIFYKKLKVKITHQNIDEVKMNKPYAIIGLIILSICTIFLIISSYIQLQMYLISAISLLTLIIIILLFSLIKRNKPIELGNTLKRTPLELIPFVISMFAIALALNKYEITNKICEFFGSNNTKFIYGYTSLVSANLVNNIPMSVIYSSIISSLSGISQINAIYATIIGSNIGAFLTPIGALAGLMWMSILKKYDIKFTFIDFIKYGSLIGLPVISVALLLLI